MADRKKKKEDTDGEVNMRDSITIFNRKIRAVFMAIFVLQASMPPSPQARGRKGKGDKEKEKEKGEEREKKKRKIRLEMHNDQVYYSQEKIRNVLTQEIT